LARLATENFLKIFHKRGTLHMSGFPISGTEFCFKNRALVLLC
jgi:hypothetical protein